MTTSAKTFPGSGALYCPHCGYDLRTLSTDACPECGGVVDVEALKKSQIPWTYRDEIGFMRAFWRTVWRVTFKTRQFSYEIARPVDFPEARRFRTTLFAWLMLTVVLPASVLILFGLVWDTNTLSLVVALPSVVGAAAVLSLFLFAFTGVHTYWFHPRHLSVEQQNRALALSYYACAPLAFFPPLAWLGAVALFLSNVADLTRSNTMFALFVILAVTGFAPAVATPVTFWRVCWVMVRFAALRGPVGQATLVIGLPIAWSALFVLIFVVILGAIAYTALIVYTLFA